MQHSVMTYLSVIFVLALLWFPIYFFVSFFALYSAIQRVMGFTALSVLIILGAVYIYPDGLERWWRGI